MMLVLLALAVAAVDARLMHDAGERPCLASCTCVCSAEQLTR